MRVLFATAELAPVASVGGLGAASAGLTAALREAGVTVDVVLPDYAHEWDRTPLDGEVRRRLDVPPWAGPAAVRIGDHPVAGRLHLVSVPRMARSHPYLRPDGTAWPDNAARFFAFSRAVASIARWEQPDVLHLNDWHTGAVLAALSMPPPSVLTVHDVAHQGVTERAWLRRLGPRSRHYEWWGGTNPLSGAIALADAIVAVSASEAREILTPAGGFGLDGPLRNRWSDVSGIRSGIDTARWDPATDRHLVTAYSGADRNLLARKAANRSAVLSRCRLPDDGTALAVMITGLSARAGVDLIAPIVPALHHVPLRLVVHGAGDRALAATLAGLASDHPRSFAFIEGYDESLAHLMMAGGDVLLLPLRHQPGETAHMEAMRYGTIPVVTAVGGIPDAVADADGSPDGTGIVADRPDSIAVVSALFRAGRLLADRRRRPALVRRIMAIDWSWRGPAAAYIERYGQVTERARSRV